MKFEMLGTTKYKCKRYSITDCTQMINPESMGLFNFYGGRVKRLGKLDVEGLYLCIEDINGIDLIKFETLAEIDTGVKSDLDDEDYIDEQFAIAKEGIEPSETMEDPTIQVKSLPRKSNKNTKKGGK